MKYYNKELLLALCKEIDMPEEISNEVAAFTEVFDISNVAHLVEDLNIPHKAEKANEALVALGDDEKGIRILTLHLTAALKARELYAQKGISDDIYLHTMGDFTLFVREQLERVGYYRFTVAFWTWRALSLLLFRLGELEFEMNNFEGRNIISTHIPANAVMTREGLDASYKWCREFFAKYFSDFVYEDICCYTWLLAPVLKTMLPEGSKILNFMADYEIIRSNPDSQEFMIRIFRKEYPDLASLPENTSLQRAVKKHLLAGGKVGDAFGRYTG